jgi:hypothetical protein
VTETDEPATELSPVVVSMALRADILRVIAEAANGYRLQLENQGWEPEVVTAMSAQVLSVWTMEALKA